MPCCVIFLESKCGKKKKFQIQWKFLMPLPNTFEKAKESGELVKSDYLFCMGMAILFWNFVPKQPLFMSFCYWLSFVLRFLFKVFFFFLGVHPFLVWMIVRNYSLLDCFNQFYNTLICLNSFNIEFGITSNLILYFYDDNEHMVVHGDSQNERPCNTRPHWQDLELMLVVRNFGLNWVYLLFLFLNIYIFFCFYF